MQINIRLYSKFVQVSIKNHYSLLYLKINGFYYNIASLHHIKYILFNQNFNVGTTTQLKELD